MPTVGIVRTRTGVLETVLEPPWGYSLRPGEDPDAPDIPEEVTDAFRLVEDFPRFPADLYNAWLALAEHYLAAFAHKGPTEVSIILTRRAPDFRVWDAWVPEQEVGSGTVENDLTRPLVNLVTGERFEDLTALRVAGHCHAGSMHSHDTYPAFPSPRDDKSELGVPGLHLIVGRLNPTADALEYETYPSIVQGHKRYVTLVGPDGIRDLDLSDVVDTSESAVTFHDDVLDQVTLYSPPPVILPTGIRGMRKVYAPLGTPENPSMPKPASPMDVSAAEMVAWCGCATTEQEAEALLALVTDTLDPTNRWVPPVVAARLRAGLCDLLE